MLKTRVTEMLGIQYPILQGGMAWLGMAELAAAVSNAGGLGMLGSVTFPTAEELRNEIHKTRELTDKPFGVNITMLPAMRILPTDDFVQVVCEERIPVVESSGSSPEQYMDVLKKANVKVIHKLGAVRHARTAERVGCDAVLAAGLEEAGHPLMDDVTVWNLVPRVVDAVNIPVIAAGGIADPRQIVAALILGAEGVMMGTRFMVTRESRIHQNIKQALVEADETSTVMIQRSIRNQTRVLRNKAAEQVVEMESRGASLEELLTVISGEWGRNAFTTGDVDVGTITCGQGLGFIQSVPTVRDVIDSLVTGAEALLTEISSRRPS